MAPTIPRSMRICAATLAIVALLAALAVTEAPNMLNVAGVTNASVIVPKSAFKYSRFADQTRIA